MKQLPFLNPQTSPHRFPEYTKMRTKDRVLGLPLIKRIIDYSAEKGKKVPHLLPSQWFLHPQVGCQLDSGLDIANDRATTKGNRFCSQW